MAKQDELAVVLRTFYEETIRPDLDRLRAEMATRADLAQVRGDVAQMEQRLRSEIQGLRGEFDEFRRDVDGHFDSLYHRLDRLDTEYQAIVEGLRRIEAAVARGEQDREAIRAEVAELRARVGALAQRLAELETRLSLPPGTH